MAEKKESAEAAVRTIRRVTRKKYSAEDKVRIVLEGLRGGKASRLACTTAPPTARHLRVEQGLPRRRSVCRVNQSETNRGSRGCGRRSVLGMRETSPSRLYR
jgi:hypothetical protein